MRQSILWLGVLTVALSLAFIGCNKPTVEMELAKEMIQDAKDAGAMNKPGSRDKLESAEKYLREGQQKMDKWDYVSAKQKFERAHKEAMRAYERAVTQVDCDECCKPGPTPTKNYKMHEVSRGECLWWIAEYDQYYGDAFQWPLIYDANREMIDRDAKSSGLPYKHPDGWAHWIFPGQDLKVPMNASMDEIKDARKRAGAPAPYLPPGK